MNENNPWKYVRVDPSRIKDNPYFTEPTPGQNKQDNSQQNNKGNGITEQMYEFMPQTDTYALGVSELKKHLHANPSVVHPQYTLSNGSKIYRPLTFKENIEARVTEYHRDKNSDGSTRTEEQKIELFGNWIDSCTGICYEGKKKKKTSTLFKIIPICNELITIDETFKKSFLPSEYSKLNGVELDSENGTYKQGLSLQQVLDHPAWNESLENDKSLLKDYAGIIFNILKIKYQQENGMGFYVRKNTDNDELRALFVRSVGSSSNASGGSDLVNYARFLRVARAKKI